MKPNPDDWQVIIHHRKWWQRVGVGAIVGTAIGIVIVAAIYVVVSEFLGNTK